jgi:uncharacterized protein
MAALLIVAFGALAFSTGKIPLGLSRPNPSKMTQVKINDNLINVDLANTPDSRKQGLSGRKSLASDSGMLFVFDKPGVYSFWMKDMKFALDFIWIKDKKVVDLIKQVPPPEPNQKDETLPIYQPSSQVDSVLEVNSGYVDSNGIKLGDSIEIIK